MPLTPKKLESNNRYLANRYESIAIRARKDEHISARLEIAAAKRGITKRDYILQTLRAQLNADGVTLDTLPPDDT